MTPTYRLGMRVRTLIPIGAKLPIGSVGLVQSVINYEPTMPDGSPRTEEQYTVTVVFPVLGNAAQQYADIPNLDPKSVPHMNAIPFRPSELELVDQLAIEPPKDPKNV